MKSQIQYSVGSSAINLLGKFVRRFVEADDRITAFLKNILREGRFTIY